MLSVPNQMICVGKASLQLMSKRFQQFISSIFTQINAEQHEIAIPLTKSAFDDFIDNFSKNWFEERKTAIIVEIQSINVFQQCSYQYEILQTLKCEVQQRQEKEIQIVYHNQDKSNTHHDIQQKLKQIIVKIISGFNQGFNTRDGLNILTAFINNLYLDCLQPYQNDEQNIFEIQYSFLEVQAQFFEKLIAQMSINANMEEQHCAKQKIKLKDQEDHQLIIRQEAEKAKEMKLCLSLILNLAQIKQVLNYEENSQMPFNSLQVGNCLQNYKKQILIIFPSISAQLLSQLQKQIIQRQQISNNLIGAKITTQNLIIPKLSQSLSQLQRKLQKMSYYQIISYTFQCDSKQLRYLAQKIKQLYSITFIIYTKYQACKKHFRNNYYVCSKQYFKDKIYLCNQCILQIKQKGNHHQGHQIYCMEHREQINCKLLVEQSKNVLLTQEFICKKCRDKMKIQQQYSCNSQLYQNIVFVSQCHYQIISEICTNLECIKNNQFHLCPICMPQMHKSHLKTGFNKKSLMKMFGTNKQTNISQYEQLYLGLMEKLKLKPIAKMVNTYYEQIWTVARSLESLIIHSDEQIQQWIQFVLTNGKKEDMFVLWGVQELKQMNLQDQDKRNYLQVFDDLFSSEQQLLLKRISQQLQHFQRVVHKISKKDFQSIDIFLSKKYQTIQNTQISNTCFIKPFILQQINQAHNHKVHEIIIIKQNQQSNNEVIDKNWRDARIKFYNKEIHKRLGSLNLQKGQINKIAQLFEKAMYNCNNNQLIKFDQLGELVRYQQHIRQLTNTLESIQNEFKQKKKLCLPLSTIIQQKFTSLKVINIQYQYIDKMFSFSDRFQYQIQAIDLFKLIHDNQELIQVRIKGVQLIKMQQFIKLLYNSCNSKQIEQKDYKHAWLQYFHPSKSLKLTLDAEIQFNLQSIDELQVKKRHFFSFVKFFHYLGNITVWIKFGKMEEIQSWAKTMEDLLLQLRKIKKIKLNLQGKGQQISPQSATILKTSLFERLEYFTEIAEPQFSGIKFSEQVSAVDLQMMQKSLSILFHDNIVTHLGLYWCYNFPVFPKIKALKSITLHQVSFRKPFNFMKEVVSTNLQLKSIKCYGTRQKWVISEQLLNQLQTLTIEDCKDICFGDINTKLPSSLKNLCIKQPSIGKVSVLSLIFPKLANLSYLKLCDINIGYEILSMIPSVHLKQLALSNNEKITNKCLEVIDFKWPYLFNIRLQNCREITQNALKICRFKRLMQLTCDQAQVGANKTALNLKNKGIKILRWS